MPPKSSFTDSDNLELLLSCLIHSDAKIDYEAVRRDLKLTGQGPYQRVYKMKADYIDRHPESTPSGKRKSKYGEAGGGEGEEASPVKKKKGRPPGKGKGKKAETAEKVEEPMTLQELKALMEPLKAKQDEEAKEAKEDKEDKEDKEE